MSLRVSRRTATTFPLIAPAVTVLVLWMIVPLALTVWFSFRRYNLQNPALRGFAGWQNYEFLLTEPQLWSIIANTLLMVGGVTAVTLVGGVLLAVLFDQPFFGRGLARLLAIAPFFVMPTVSALVWKNLLMHPVNGVIAFFTRSLGFEPIAWLDELPLTSIVLIVSWQWLPFALLILLTAMQSLDQDLIEAARMDGAGPFARFWHVILPHLRRAIGVVIMIELIFFLAIFAEIYVTTTGGPGIATTNLTFLIYKRALLEYDIGAASAASMLMIVLANCVAIFFVRTIAQGFDSQAS